MEFVLKMLNLQFMLFALIIVGILSHKMKIITCQNRKAFSDLLINIVLPCNIVNSFLSKIEISSAFFHNCLLAILLSSCIQIFATAISKVLFSRFEKDEKNIMSYGMICSNSSFIGLPVAEVLYGSLGVMYTSIYQIPARFTMWTAGLSLFTEVTKKDACKKLIKHPCIIAIFVGFFLMLLPVSLPAFIQNTIASISRCTIPLSMFVIGAILAEADIRTIFSKKTLYYTVIRLILFPLFIYAVLWPFHLDSLLVSICVIMSGMPAGSTTSVLADKYGVNPTFASQIIFVSTLFSIFTIPILELLL
ncbi:MAG: AEC family transporter, partial [Roseburia sp.]